MANVAAWAGQLRSSKKQSNEEEQTTTSERRDGRLRAASKMALGAVAKGGIKKVAIAKVAKATNGAKIATNRLLSASWLSLIPSFGLTLIWINIHAFMHMLFPSVFGKLGEEWLPGQAQAGEVSGSVKTTNQSLGMVEKMALVLLDVLFIVVVFGVLALLIFLFDAIWGILGWFFDWFGINESAIKVHDAMMGNQPEA